MPPPELRSLQPVCQWFASVPDTGTAAMVAEALATLQDYPQIAQLITADLDRRALQAQACRRADAEWGEARTPLLLASSAAPRAPAPRGLGTGRPRTDPQLVYLALVLRGRYGSVSDADAVDRFLESTTLTVFCQNRNLRRPDRTTLLRHLNAISDETRNAILDLQLQRVQATGLDPCDTVVVDSTAVAANTRWPTDSGLLLDALAGAYRRCRQVSQRFGLPPIATRWCAPRLARLRQHDFRISTWSGKGRAAKQRAEYRHCYGLGTKLAAHLRHEFETVLAPAAAAANLRPSVQARLQQACATIQDRLAAAERLLGYSPARVLHGATCPVREKVLSLTDGDAGFIQKGDRDPVIGYKPQLARSGHGFVIALGVAPGNPADAPALVPLLAAAIRRTGTVPTTVSTDDGYTAAANRSALLGLGVKHVSFSGAKGRALTPVAEWDSPALTTARRERSAVESMIFVLKYDYAFGRLRRRGLASVRAELLEKAIAFNFARMIVVRQHQAEEAQRRAAAARAAPAA